MQPDRGALLRFRREAEAASALEKIIAKAVEKRRDPLRCAFEHRNAERFAELRDDRVSKCSQRPPTAIGRRWTLVKLLNLWTTWDIHGGGSSFTRWGHRFESDSAHQKRQHLQGQESHCSWPQQASSLSRRPSVCDRPPSRDLDGNRRRVTVRRAACAGHPCPELRRLRQHRACDGQPGPNGRRGIA